MGETQYVCNNDNRIMFDTEDSEYGCLCTFPHNYEVSGKKLNKWTIASLALLGAGIAISANKASSMIGSDDKYIDSYYLPNCIPQWIRDEFDRILELSKEEPDIITEEEYTMKELTFEITNIQSERGINGKTNIRATCIQDDMWLEIEIPNSELNNKSSVKQSLIIEHMRLLELEKEQNYYIQKGSII